MPLPFKLPAIVSTVVLPPLLAASAIYGMSTSTSASPKLDKVSITSILNAGALESATPTLPQQPPSAATVPEGSPQHRLPPISQTAAIPLLMPPPAQPHGRQPPTFSAPLPPQLPPPPPPNMLAQQAAPVVYYQMAPGQFPYTMSQPGAPGADPHEYASHEARRGRRYRRRYLEIVRLYSCLYPGCDKLYGSLNHLNTHIVTKRHGQRKLKADFQNRDDRTLAAAAAASAAGSDVGSFSQGNYWYGGRTGYVPEQAVLAAHAAAGQPPPHPGYVYPPPGMYPGALPIPQPNSPFMRAAPPMYYAQVGPAPIAAVPPPPHVAPQPHPSTLALVPTSLPAHSLPSHEGAGSSHGTP